MLYVKNGSYTVLLDNSKYTIEAGDLILFCSNTTHYAFSGTLPSNSYYVLKISPAFLMEMSGREQKAEYVMRFAINRKGNKILWCKDELIGSEIKIILDRLISEYETQGYAFEIAMKLKTMELLLAILREDDHTEANSNDRITELIYGVMGYIQEHYEEDIDEKALAKDFGMSYSYFSRSFKRVTSRTFKNYLNITRIRKAEQLLCRSDLSISEIATACGYNSISYFINVYRTVTGHTPYKAIKRLSKNNENKNVLSQ
jgi:AraC-like DNA-binding protein